MPWIAAGAAVIGGVLGKEGQDSANATNVGLQQQQEQWEQQMSSTAYQRAVGDMQSAGLNPMLAYSQGGASTPNVQAATVGNAIGAGVSSAQSSADLVSQIQNRSADTQQKVATAKQAESQADLNAAQGLRVKAQTATELEMPDYWKQKLAESIASTAVSDATGFRLKAQNAEGIGQWEGRNAFENYAANRVQRQSDEGYAQSHGGMTASTSNLSAHSAAANADARFTNQGFQIRRPLQNYSGSGWAQGMPYANDAAGLMNSAARAGSLMIP